MVESYSENKVLRILKVNLPSKNTISRRRLKHNIYIKNNNIKKSYKNSMFIVRIQYLKII